MVLVQVDLSEKANKNLDLFKIYNNFKDKRDALNNLLESLDLAKVRDDFFTGNNEGGMI